MSGYNLTLCYGIGIDDELLHFIIDLTEKHDRECLRRLKTLIERERQADTRALDHRCLYRMLTRLPGIHSFPEDEDGCIHGVFGTLVGKHPSYQISGHWQNPVTPIVENRDVPEPLDTQLLIENEEFLDEAFHKITKPSMESVLGTFIVSQILVDYKVGYYFIPTWE